MSGLTGLDDVWDSHELSKQYSLFTDNSSLQSSLDTGGIWFAIVLGSVGSVMIVGLDIVILQGEWAVVFSCESG